MELHDVLRTVLRTSGLAMGFGVLAYALERLTGARTTQYGTVNFRHDVVYWLGYQWGAMIPIMAAVHHTVGRIPGLDLHALAGYPRVLHYLVFWIVSDLASYWVHRLMHANPYLWSFHLVHHSQEALTFATASRTHPVDQYLGAAWNFAALSLLGAPPEVWFPLHFALRTLPAVLQHTELAWRWGPFYRLIVSPTFHAVHHSTEREHHDRNFGITLSVWDFLFGTAVTPEVRPRVYGVAGVRLPSLVSQQWVPFQLVARTLRGRRRVVSTPVG